MTYAQSQRLSYIDWLLLTQGSVRRGQLVETFGVSMPQASIDLGQFDRAYPDTMRYDLKAKQYIPANGRYRSVTGWTARRVETWATAAAAGVPWAWG